jgi:hypothetical protein
MATHGHMYRVLSLLSRILPGYFIVTREQVFLLSGPRQFITAEQLKTFDSSLVMVVSEELQRAISNH